MASAASGSGLIQSSSARQLGPDSASSKGKARTTAIPTAKPLRRSRIVRPRIDIDDQIFEGKPSPRFVEQDESGRQASEEES